MLFDGRQPLPDPTLEEIQAFEKMGSQPKIRQVFQWESGKRILLLEDGRMIEWDWYREEVKWLDITPDFFKEPIASWTEYIKKIKEKNS